jgi:glyoxylase I family protein
LEKVVGIGGMFFRAEDPEALREWYADNLGVVDSPDGV